MTEFKIVQLLYYFWNLPDFSVQIHHWSPEWGKLIQTGISEKNKQAQNEICITTGSGLQH